VLAIDEHDEHKYLCGSCRRSIIPYVHGGDECCIVVCLLKSRLSLLEVSLRILTSTRPFIAQGHDSYITSQGPTGGPGVVAALYDKTLIDRNSK
jgi:hypothetical protein